jgi:SAM-dependent methyltransferase
MNDYLGKKLNNIRVNNVLPFVNGKLLDVGCGLNKLVRAYNNGIGVDVYDFGDADLLVEDTSNLPFESESFDTITIIAALNHIPNRKDVVRECHRLLKADGQVIITMLSPTISRLWHKIREPWDEDQKVRGMKEGEVFGMSKKEIMTIFSDSSFTLKSHKRFMLFLNSLYVFTK